MNGGFVIGFGNNQDGIFGVNPTKPVTFHKDFVSIHSSFAVDVSRVSLGNDHCFFISKDNKIYFTGVNKHGQFGSVSHSKADKLTLFSNSLLKIQNAEAHLEHSVFWNDKGEIFTCGKGGLLGHAVDDQKSAPTLVAALKDKNIRLYCSGFRHSMAVDSQNNLYGWGKTELIGGGQFNKIKKVSTTTREPLYVEAAPFLNWKILKIACGDDHTLALVENGCVWGWGRGDEYQLGHGVKETRASPILIEPLKAFDIVHLSCGSNNSVLVNTNKECYVWGQWGNVIIQKPEIIGKALQTPIKHVEQIHQSQQYNIILTPNQEVYTFGADITVSKQDPWFPLKHKIDDPSLMYKKITQVAASSSNYYMIVYEGTPIHYSVEGINYANKELKVNKNLPSLAPQSKQSQNLNALLSKPTTTTTTTTTSSKYHNDDNDSNL
ncbi:hypothetical protein DLAC_11212 [Tieghemostelium lacteum]|uniref:RCC1-like domain-containing protein n=1 Tax=Tieghemostelium lacteum TaxID=361077 RepID=A0A151Z3H8_TIELA|nr:hypothetical protein DLAC_11212 [Tieghemostelium lacteum]|eukprot:KYQ88498.1 hypothetical protein DLAC_11212 [Tieghemostelium lacteum]